MHEPGAADRPLRADHAAGRAPAPAPPTAARVFELFAAPAARAGVGTAWSPASGGPSTRSRRSGSPTTSSPPARAGRRRRADPRLARRLPLHRRHLGLRRGRDLLPGLPAAGRRVHASPRRCCSRRCCSRSSTTTRAIASAASRMTWRAGERPCIEMGSRRTHEWAAVAAARAAYVAGFAATLQPPGRAASTASRRPAPRALVHAAARHRARRLPRPGPVARQGHDPARRHLRHRARRSGSAVEVAGPELGAVRIDSGDLRSLAHQVRAQLDDLGATKTRIIVTSDLDEFAIAGLAAAPVDGYGVGTSARHRQRPPDLRLRLQARRARATRRMTSSDAAGREEEHGQDLGRRPQVRAAPARPRRHRRRPR